MAEKTWIVEFNGLNLELSGAEYTKIKELAMDDANSRELRYLVGKYVDRQKAINKKGVKNG